MADVKQMTVGEIQEGCRRALDGWRVDGCRLLVVIPDLTRTCPLPVMFPILYASLAPRVSRLTFLVALGTHPALPLSDIYRLVGITAEEHRARYPKAEFFNHAWDDPTQLACVGTIPAKDIRDLSEGRFEMDVPVTINKLVLEHDRLLIAGPVFPHEVVGFSGGNKYLFPGICGPELLNVFHWLGALITNKEIIGCKWTPVRRLLDRAATMVPGERRALCMVVYHGGLAGLFWGTPEQAWSEAADLSDRLHIEYKPRPFHTVLSCAPKMYDELWVGAKCMYKLEPAVADGGTLIIYAPHIAEISVTHGKLIEQIGYHTRDFFVKQWDAYKHLPWGILAHSTHVKGGGTFDNGVEKPRIDVVLATAIPEAVCRKINLGYMDWRSIRVEDYQGREAEGVLHVPKAGEILYRIKA